MRDKCLKEIKYVWEGELSTQDDDIVVCFESELQGLNNRGITHNTVISTPFITTPTSPFLQNFVHKIRLTKDNNNTQNRNNAV